MGAYLYGFAVRLQQLSLHNSLMSYIDFWILRMSFHAHWILVIVPSSSFGPPRILPVCHLEDKFNPIHYLINYAATFSHFPLRYMNCFLSSLQILQHQDQHENLFSLFILISPSVTHFVVANTWMLSPCSTLIYRHQPKINNNLGRTYNGTHSSFICPTSSSP